MALDDFSVKLSSFDEFYVNDPHYQTLKKDLDFHAFMDQVFPGWRDWSLKEQRQAAKQWNFSKLHGTRK